MTTIDVDLSRLRPGDALPTTQKVARNPSAASENKIHDDTVARDYGFRGGLVPGATSYSYLASHLANVLGPGWAAYGTSSIALVRPVYEGETVILGGEVTQASGDTARGSLAASVWVDGPDGTRCAPGAAALTWGEPHPEEPIPDFARAGIAPREPSARGPISKATAPLRQPLPTVEYTEEAARAYLDDIEDETQLFRASSPFGGPLLHPGLYPSIANRVLSANFALGPWIHTKSEVRHLAPALLGGTYRAYGELVDAFEKRGHEYVTADVLITDAADQPVCRMLHTAIVVVAKRS